MSWWEPKLIYEREKKKESISHLVHWTSRTHEIFARSGPPLQINPFFSNWRKKKRRFWLNVNWEAEKAKKILWKKKRSLADHKTKYYKLLILRTRDRVRVSNFWNYVIICKIDFLILTNKKKFEKFVEDVKWYAWIVLFVPLIRRACTLEWILLLRFYVRN